MTTDIATLRDEVDRLNKEKLAIEERLKLLSGRRPIQPVRGNNNNRKRPFGSEAYQNERPSTKPRVMSTVAAVIHRDDTTPKESVSADEPTSSKPSVRETNSNPDTVKRNRRMFGALMGHLGKAQRSLEVDSSLIEKQAAAKSVAMEKHAAEGKRILNKQRVISLHEKNKELNLRDEVVAKRRKAELALQTIAFKEEQEKLLDYIITNTIPSLPWRPGRVNATAEKLLQERKLAVAKLLAEREASDAEARNQIDADVAEKRNKRLSEEEALGSAATENNEDTTGVDEQIPDKCEVNYEDKDEEDEGDRILAALEGNRDDM